MTLSDRLRSSPFRVRFGYRMHRAGVEGGDARVGPGGVFRNASLGGLISKSTPFFAEFVCGSINARSRYMNRYRVLGRHFHVPAFRCPPRDPLTYMTSSFRSTREFAQAPSRTPSATGHRSRRPSRQLSGPTKKRRRR